MSTDHNKDIKIAAGKIVARLKQVVTQNFVPGACWEWQGAKNQEGYGTIMAGKRMWRTHRVMWTNTYGEIPEGLVVMHLCNNPKCCNPDHLRVGTLSDNSKYHHKTSKNAVYTPDQVKHIIDNPTIRSVDIAKDMGVPYSFVYNVRTGKVWNQITGLPKKVRK